MKLTYQQLQSHLKNQLLPMYFIVGTEPLFVQESKDLLNRKANQQGFTEKKRFETTKDFNWQTLFDSANSLSLFGEKTVFELKLQHKPNAAVAKLFAEFLQKLAPENLLILLCDKVEAATQKSSWFQTIAERGAIINIWPLEKTMFAQWITQRLQDNQLGTNPALVQFIMEQTEGNALAAAQEIEKLKLIYPKGEIPFQELEHVIADNARHDIFSLIEIVLAGNAAHVTQVLKKIHAEGIEAPIVLWAITREIRTLLNVQQALKNREPWELICKRNNIWGKRSTLLKNSITKHPAKFLHNCLLHATQIDQMIKGMLKGNIWDELQLLALGVSGSHYMPGKHKVN